MNIRIIEIISLFCLVIQFACCQNQDDNKVQEILIASSVRNNFVSSDENSDFIIGDKKYWVHYKVSYKNDTLNQFKKYLPEGPIEYSIEELKSDTAIYKSLKIPLRQNLQIYGDALYERSKKLDLELIKLDEKHFMEKNGKRVFVIK